MRGADFLDPQLGERVLLSGADPGPNMAPV